MTGYAIVEKNYEYNDEIEFCRSDAGFPSKVFLDKDKAKLAAQELNAKKFAGIVIGNYCYSLEEILNRRIDRYQAEDKLAVLLPGLSNDSLYNFEIPENTNIDTLKAIAHIFSQLSFYSIHEIEIEDLD